MTSASERLPPSSPGTQLFTLDCPTVSSWQLVAGEEADPLIPLRPMMYVASFETAFVKGYVYFVGQFDKVENYNRVHRFDPVKRVWQEVAPIALSRDTCTEPKLFLVLLQIYICGGNNGNDCLSTAEVYDPIVDQWSMIAPMTIQRSGMGVIAYKDEVGGFEGENDLKTAEAYNPQTDTWRSVSSMINARSYFGIETMEDLLYVVGGNDDFTTYAKVECYNKESDEIHSPATLSGTPF
uniref:Uncharacterized protein n=1 Tax=Erpetoichthys calabaricus TaxID=27687 RepID=A0A8C4XI20_ERPCA